MTRSQQYSLRGLPIMAGRMLRYTGAILDLTRYLLAIPMPARAWAVIFAEAIVIGFFALLAYTGYEVLVVLEGEYLVSLTWIPIQLTQSVIPIGASLFVLCEILSFPDYYKKTCAGISLEHAEIEEEVETELAKAGVKS